jgi:hypothetical protein
LLIGRLDEAEAVLAGLDPAPLPPLPRAPRTSWPSPASPCGA